MPRAAGRFSRPEREIAVAYLMLAMPVEPQSPTQLVFEALCERFDMEYERKGLSGMTPHEWQAQYGAGEEGAASAR